MSDRPRAANLGRIALKRRPAAAGEGATAPPSRHEALVALSHRVGVPALDLEQVCIRAETLRLVPLAFAQRLHLLPCLIQADRLFVAMANPRDRAAVHQTEAHTRLRVYAYAAPAAELSEVIEQAYAAERRGESHFIGAQCPLSTLRKAGLEPRVVSEPVDPVQLQERKEGPGVSPAVESQAAEGSGAWLAHALSAPPPPRMTSLPPALRGSLAPPDGPLTASITDFSPSLEELVRDLHAQGSALEQKAHSGSSKSGPPLPGGLSPSIAPLAPSPAAAAGPLGDELSGRADTPSEVLVVDDDPAVRTWVARALAQIGCAVTCASTGKQALEVLRHRRPNALVLDLQLPDLHGFDIARRLHVSSQHATLPIVVISGVYRGWRFAEDLKATCGVAAYLEKPVSFEGLTRAVGEVLRGKSAFSPPPERLATRTEEALRQGLEASRDGRLDEAIGHLERGVALDPLAPALHFQLGALYSKVGRVFEGIAALENGLELNSNEFSAVRNLAILYYYAGFRNRAAELWERGLQLAPDEATRTAIKEHLIQLLS